MRVIFIKLNYGDSMGLTLGKSYEVLECKENTQKLDVWGDKRYLIVGDDGDTGYYTEPFVMEYRKCRRFKLAKLRSMESREVVFIKK